jgi:hypothetical protein
MAQNKTPPKWHSLSIIYDNRYTEAGKTMENSNKGAQMKQNNNNSADKAQIVSQSKMNLTAHCKTMFQVLMLTVVISSCTKNRKAELPEDAAPDIFAISTFGSPDDNSNFSANKTDVIEASDSGLKALDLNQTNKLLADDVTVPGNIKFMFDKLPLTNQKSGKFKITFTVDKKNVTAYKVAANVSELNAIEKSLAISTQEAKLLTKLSRANKAELKALSLQQKSAALNREQIKTGKATGSLLVPMFKYEIAEYGILERTKNELKEETSVLRLKKTDWSASTHIQISSRTDSRKVVGVDATQVKAMNQIFDQDKLNHQLTTAGELSSQLKIGLKFLDDKTVVMTKLSADALLIYEVTDVSKLTPEQTRIYKSGGSAGNVISCQNAEVKAVVKSKDSGCVVVLVASAPVKYKKLELALADTNGETSSAFESTDVPMLQSVGLVEILENTSAIQKEVTGLLDPDSSIKISDLTGEFMFRRTFEDAASSFLGRTGTSGDMALVKFELEKDRLVVRNQLSLIKYTGQGAKDREEIMSIPVRYFYIKDRDSHGSNLGVDSLVETTKEKANYIQLDWTKNTIPDATSPLAFFDAGSCFISDSSKQITNTDMRLAKDGVLNFSISSSHTVQPGCATRKDVNSAYWSGSEQYNFNVVERISFVKHTNKDKTDTQFSQNISSMAQEAFNFGVFTLADNVNNNNTYANRDGSEKYMPMIHDLRNGKKIRWYLGGINDSAATDPERRQLLIDAAKQVIAEWNRTFAYAMKGTSLERSSDYVELIIEDAGKETGRLGDLNRNYIWLNEIPADNGLLGVAQPAANPRSGVIESANVIVYTGNTFEQTRVLLKMTAISRAYETKIEGLKKNLIEQAKTSQTVVSSKDQADKAANKDADTATVRKASNLTRKNAAYLKNLVKYFELENKNIKKSISGMQIGQSAEQLRRVLNKNTFKNSGINPKIDLPTNSMTLTQKMTDLAMDKKLSQNESELELRMNDLFINYGGLNDQVKEILKKRQQILALSASFDKATAKRAGCFQYSRNDANDEALTMDADPHKNLMLNFKQAVMSTLSHELGHAFGLLHNFKASTDKENYEFPGEKNTGRNYSSIMDYISDIDQHYAGPGPYDAHAIRAAYTGYVELSKALIENSAAIEKIKSAGVQLINGRLIHVNDAAKLMGTDSFVHFTKETLNKIGVIKHYEQCSDGGTFSSIMCNRFDTGGSATEIVNNMIADYSRTYANRNYVFDKILFGWPQKIQVITRNMRLFSDIRKFLDETFMTAIYGSGRPDATNQKIMQDRISATLAGYRFFHELIRTPGTSASFADVDKRLQGVPYQYEVTTTAANGEKTKSVQNDVRIIEQRSLYDVKLNEDKIDTIGISYDKTFAMNFLMQTSTAYAQDASEQGYISYKDFEQFFLGVTDPKDSLTINTMAELLTNNLKVGFFDPNGGLIQVNAPVEANKMFSENTALAAVIGLNQSKWKAFDSFAESFKMARSTVQNAPKDRLNVTRLGQDRTKSDTTVYFATQNGVVADVLIQQAARGDILLSNRKELFQNMSELMTADKEYLGKINQIRDAACVMNDDGKLKDEAACSAAYKKQVAEYVKEDTTLIPAKQKADQIAAKLVQQVRELNRQGGLMNIEFDKPEGKANFNNQVEIMRSLLNDQTNVLEKIKNDLEKSPKENLNQTIKAVQQIMQQVRPQNDQLSAIPLLSYSQSFLIEFAKRMVINLQSGEKLTGDVIMSAMMDGNKISNDHEKIVDVIDKLTQFSRLVDTDLLVTK